ncbi:hypothetical protein [Methylomonas sp. AM2-LC]|uniref:hypothetical protein n=1 Tax=Methylomonas sp. AM2-LC TaxID=3153301 RepID=UPI003263CC48
MKIISLGLIAVFLLSACVSKQHFRTDISAIPCQVNSQQNCLHANLIQNEDDAFTLGFVEIDDQGQFYDNRQVETLIKTLKNQTQAQYVTLYVHGWHHNADADDSSISRFKTLLTDTKRRHPQLSVTGIYIGWRGETLTLPGLRALTFADRKLVSEEVGRNALLDFLLQVETAVKVQGNAENRLITIGHSLGASVTFNALYPILLQHLLQPEDNSVRKGFGDLVVLINPAFEATRYTTLRHAAQRYAQQFQFSPQQNPLLVVATSANDLITKLDFSLSRQVTTLFEQHRMLDNHTQELQAPLSEWELDTTSIGHFHPFITHRLQTHAALTDQYHCSTSTGWLNLAVERQTTTLATGWDTGDNISQPALFTDSSQLQVSHLQNSTNYDPYWVVQTDSSIFPTHGFITQPNFWCFIDQLVEQAVD